MAVHLFVALTIVAGAKEPHIAGRAAIRIMKQHMVEEPILQAPSSRTKDLFAAATGTTMYVSLGSNFFHAGTPLPGGRMLQRLGALMEVQVWPRYVPPNRTSGDRVRAGHH